ncbi:ribosome biogenesis regulatory protein homolog [Lycorma delicatula]|uniref:ribosome biogenesis regulatory protein homolog n=1 Tax=Lycorma delicatula TaxID=130591 RepID=UPI003F50F8F9
MDVDIVTEAFNKVAKEKGKYKSTNVEKLLDLEYDLGTLLAIDTNEINMKELRSNKKDEYLLNLARDNTQLLINRLWELPFEKVEEATVVKLPQQSYILPREKPLPKPRQLSKWEVFAKEKGLQKKKKAKVTWDDILKKWVPVHGFRRAAAEKEKNWLLEVPANADPYEDQFEKKIATQREKVAKNEYQRLRNIATAHNIKVPHMGVPPTEKLTSAQLETAEGLARISTASIGKFQPRLPKEKAKEKKLPGTKKRKIAPVPAAEEKESNLGIINSILNKKPKLDISKAVNKQIFEEQSQRAEEKKKFKGKGGKKQGKKHGIGKPSGSKKPAAGKGRRNPHKKAKGRKRR